MTWGKDWLIVWVNMMPVVQNGAPHPCGVSGLVCVTGGVEGPNQSQTCSPDEHYLHDGRARTLDEAIRWHGGEDRFQKDAYMMLTDTEREAVGQFLRSL